MTTPTRTSSPLDLNLLPERHRPRRLTTTTILLLALLVALLGLTMPAWQWFAGATASYAATTAEGDQLRTAIARSGPASEALDTLATQVAVAEERAGLFEQALDSLGVRAFAWSEVLPVLAGRTPEGVSITAVTDQGDSILLTGVATDESLPLLYARILTSSGLFDVVQMEVIDRLPADLEETPSPTPRVAATPTAAPTPQPSPRFTFSMTIIVQEGSAP